MPRTVEGATSAWSADLIANSRRPGLPGSVAGWLLSPGQKAVTIYRWSRAFATRGTFGKLASKLLWRWNVRTTGCYLSPLADIGPGLAMPHAIGVVVGEGVTIGTGVTLYQHVTLGRSRSDQPVYPKVGDNVIIYAGAIIAGGVTIGDNAVIGANAVVIRDVPAGTTAVGNPARLLS